MLAFELFSDQSHADIDDLDGYQFDAWKDDIDGKLLRSLLTGAQRLV